MRPIVTCTVIAATALLSGCETLSLTALGIDGSAAVNQKVNGSPTRTFTAPLHKVKLASVWALKRMASAFAGEVSGGSRRSLRGLLR